MSMLENLGAETRGLVETVKPFESWEGTPVKDWTFTFQLLGVGDLADIARWIADASAFESIILKKIFVVAKSLTMINGCPIVTDEDLEQYNAAHNLMGAQKFTIFQLKVLQLRQLNEAIINKLAYTYDQLEEKYLENHLGDALYKALKALSSVDTLNAAAAITAADQLSSEQSSPETENDSAAPTTP